MNNHLQPLDIDDCQRCSILQQHVEYLEGQLKGKREELLKRDKELESKDEMISNLLRDQRLGLTSIQSAPKLELDSPDITASFLRQSPEDLFASLPDFSSRDLNSLLRRSPSPSPESKKELSIQASDFELDSASFQFSQQGTGTIISETPPGLTQFFRPTPSSVQSNEIISESSPIVKSRSYSSVLRTSPTISSTNVHTPIKATLSRQTTPLKAKLEKAKKMKCIHMIGFPYMLKIGKLRNKLKLDGFRVDDILNLCFIGNQVLELIIKESGYKQFIKRARSITSLYVYENYDPSDPSDATLDSYLKGVKGDKSIGELRNTFIERIAREYVNCIDSNLKEFYQSWAMRMKMERQFDDYCSMVWDLATVANCLV